jgi:two-component system cell cycle response regulator DivK
MGLVPKRILVVEDDDSILRILTHALERAGYEVVPTRNGEEALSCLGREDFDLVLTDLAMPQVSGLEVIRAVKNDPLRRRTPTVAVTAHWLDPLSRAAEAAGCDGFLAKPFTSAALLREVSKHLGPPPTTAAE